MASEQIEQTYDVSFRKIENQKSSSHFVKIGIAFQITSGRIDLKLDALPIDWDGRLFLFPHKEE